MTRRRVGVIGAGVSGMTAAWLLQHDHRVTLFDGSPRFGGHAETVPVVREGKTVYAELGARFFFDSAYPYFLGLLRLLEVPVRWSDAGVSFTEVSNGRTVVLPPRSPRQVVSLLRSPATLRHVVSLRHLIQEQPEIARARDFSVTLREHLARRDYPAAFGPDLLYPFLAACWGAPLDALPDFPVYSLLKGMPPGNQPGFYEVPGGMSAYMRTFGAALTDVDVQLGVAARRIAWRDGPVVVDAEGREQRFDHVIVATSSRDAAELLRGVSVADELHSAIASFRHFDTDIVVHGDLSLMPKDARDWSHTNLFFEKTKAWMTDWPGLHERVPVFRTWLPKGRELPSPLYGRRSYHHLVMSPENALLQRRIASLQGRAGLWITGMYAADVDNHESALLSAVVPARALAPHSKNLARLLGAVRDDAPHGLEVLPSPMPAPPPPADVPRESGSNDRPSSPLPYEPSA